MRELFWLGSLRINRRHKQSTIRIIIGNNNLEASSIHRQSRVWTEALDCTHRIVPGRQG